MFARRHDLRDFVVDEALILPSHSRTLELVGALDPLEDPRPRARRRSRREIDPRTARGGPTLAKSPRAALAARSAWPCRDGAAGLLQVAGTALGPRQPRRPRLSRGDEGLYPLRDRVVGFWLGPGYFREYTARTEAEAYRGRGVPLMRGRYRRCASQQGNAQYSVVTLGIADDRAHSLAERLLHWQWPDGGWNCDRHPEADTSSFMETLLPMLGLGAYARRYRRPSAAKAARAAADVFLRRRLFKRVSDGRVIASDFVALHYPRYWHYDYLAGLIAIAKIGMIRDARCTEALDLLEEHRLPDGGWPAEKRYYKVSPKAMVSNADYVDWGGTARRRMNEWVTVDALAVLRAAGRFPA